MTDNIELNEAEIREKLAVFKDNLVASISSASEKINLLEKEMIELHSELSNLKRQDFLSQTPHLPASDMETQLKGLIRPEFDRMIQILLENFDPSSKLKDTSKKNSQEVFDGDIDNKVSVEDLQEVEAQLESQRIQYEKKISSLERELQIKSQENEAMRHSLDETNSREIEHSPSSNSDEIDEASELEFLTAEIESLKIEIASAEQRRLKDQKIIKGYKTELTYLKKILGDKNTQIKELISELSVLQENKEKSESEKEDSSPFTEPVVNKFQIDSQNLIKEMEKKINEITTELKAEKNANEEKNKIINVQNSTIRSSEATIKRLEGKIREHENETTLIKANQELDQIIKTLWKIEKNIGIFEKTSDLDRFERHLEVYSLLLGKIFESRPLALVLDCLLKNKTQPLNKRIIIQECGLEPFTAIKLLKELHKAKVLYFDEERDQIELLM